MSIIRIHMAGAWMWRRHWHWPAPLYEAKPAAMVAGGLWCAADLQAPLSWWPALTLLAAAALITHARWVYRRGA